MMRLLPFVFVCLFRCYLFPLLRPPTHYPPLTTQFLRLGFDGYNKIFANLKKIAKRLANALVATGMHGGMLIYTLSIVHQEPKS